MDVGSVNFPYLLAQYLRRYASSRKRGAQMSRGHFVARLADHFGLLTKERLHGLTVVVCDLTVIDMDELARLRICERTARFEEEVHGLQESLGEQREVLSGMSRDFVRFTTWTFGRLSQLLDAGGVTYTSYSDYQISYQRRTRWRTGEASTSAAPYIDDQPDP
ncbi:hypothetical protein Tco_0949800 [Tanacetum coccineum]